HARHGESSDGHGFFLRVASLLSVDSVSSWQVRREKNTAFTAKPTWPADGTNCRIPPITRTNDLTTTTNRTEKCGQKNTNLGHVSEIFLSPFFCPSLLSSFETQRNNQRDAISRTSFSCLSRVSWFVSFVRLIAGQMDRLRLTAKLVNFS